ncbi:bridging integrator [Anaeramoeba flamelloides]|uniref:Bridging integrator n=1 Tax=Anaeramoeba flamelloides TaxID=1746091 RepID=A0AAV7ZFF6_9EUKA|nr:bridging integrator [Anaeramoeba flamelloides]
MQKKVKVRRYLQRNQQKLLQSFGKANKTVDLGFDESLGSFVNLKQDTEAINQKLINFINCLDKLQGTSLQLSEDLSTFFTNSSNEDQNTENLNQLLTTTSTVLEKENKLLQKNVTDHLEIRIDTMKKIQKSISERNKLLTQSDFHERKYQKAKLSKKKTKEAIEILESASKTSQKEFQMKNNKLKKKMNKYTNNRDLYLNQMMGYSLNSYLKTINILEDQLSKLEISSDEDENYDEDEDYDEEGEEGEEVESGEEEEVENKEGAESEESESEYETVTEESDQSSEN